MKTEEAILFQGLDEYIIKIVQKTRTNPEILRGVSPRGSIAFKELVNALNYISGNINKEIVKKAALITLPHRILLKPNSKKTPYEIIEEIVEEVFHEEFYSKDHLGLSEKELERILSTIWEKLNKTQFGGAEENSFFLSEKLAKDLMDESEVLKELKSKKSNSKDDLQFMKEVCESLKDRGYLFSKKISNYTFTKKALEKLGRGFNKNTQIDEKSVHQFRESKGKPFMSLNNPLQKKSALKNTFQLLNDVMDVQDALFGAGITLQDLYVNNILKSNFRKLQLENDYEKLQVVIENLKNEGLLKDVDSSSGILCLTPEAIDFLLNYSISILNFKENLIHKGSKKKCLDGEKIDIKKFSLGDFYRNLSVQHTLKGLARKRKLLKDIERKDLRFFIKKPKQGLDVVLAIDASGSMAQDSKFKLAKLIAAGLIKIILDRGGKIALTAFNDLSETLTSYTDEKNLLFENLIKLRASRNTNIGEGIKSSLRLSLKNGLEKGEKRIILITDGEPTATSKNALKDLKFSENSVLGEAYAIQEARRAKKYGVTVSVIAISKKNSRKGLIFAEKLARTGGGVFYKIEDMKDLDNIIRCEFLRLNKSK